MPVARYRTVQNLQKMYTFGRSATACLNRY